MFLYRVKYGGRDRVRVETSQTVGPNLSHLTSAERRRGHVGGGTERVVWKNEEGGGERGGGERGEGVIVGDQTNGFGMRN